MTPLNLPIEACMRRTLVFLSILLFAAAPSQLLSEPLYGEDAPYVTCDIKGGLGNQLYEISTTLAYAWDHGAIPVFPDLNNSNYHLPVHRHKIFFRLDSSSPPRPFSTSYQEISWFSSEDLPFRPDQRLIGYFQAWRRFDHYRDRLLEVFAPSDTILSYLNQKYGKLISRPNTVGVHVRTFNATLHASKIHPFMGMEYYAKAMAMFPPDTIFVIFSDRINWCKKHFPKLKRPCVFIEGNDEIEDFFLMSMMKHQIMPNSTFSWWAAYLNKNPDKIVIGPTSLQHPDLFAFPLRQPNDFYLPEWVLVEPNYSEPYPADMTDYDNIPWDGN